MVELKRGRAEFADELPNLIYQSASSVLDFIFDGQSNALAFLTRVSNEPEGQFSANRHHFACIGGNPVGCVSLWHTELPSAFHTATFSSLKKFLTVELFEYVVSINPLLVSTFEPPKDHQLCFGHLSVKQGHRGQNIGSKLLAYIIRMGHQMQKQELALDVEASNDEALQVYERWGFIVKSEQMLAPLNQIFYRMTRPL
ncbi:MAG: GNAT family N-acetyltransferase [Pseudomonadota bacterium]